MTEPTDVEPRIDHIAQVQEWLNKSFPTPKPDPDHAHHVHFAPCAEQSWDYRVTPCAD